MPPYGALLLGNSALLAAGVTEEVLMPGNRSPARPGREGPGASLHGAVGSGLHIPGEVEGWSATPINAHAVRRCTVLVLNLVRQVMARVPPRDKDLVDIYHVRGNANPILIAVALDAIAESEETPLVENWQIVTDDEGVKKKAAKFDPRTVTSAEFKKLVDAKATGKHI